jgi:ribonuclease HI
MNTQNELKQVTIYTDGGCEPNPGPGGYGVVLLFGEARKELSGGYRLTTNNRMEIIAAIRGLEALKEPCRVRLYSDSEYLVKAMTLGWVRRWKANGWKRNRKEHALNVDLWERMLELTATHDVEFVWVKGHAGDPYNERCDQLSYAALKKKNLPVDEGYENRLEDTVMGGRKLL